MFTILARPALLDEPVRTIAPAAHANKSTTSHALRRPHDNGALQRGRLRVDGGEGGFAEHPVSRTHCAWVLLAADDVAENGGVLDEARVNKLRYLDGTPKGATQWIDTGQAIRLWRLAAER